MTTKRRLTRHQRETYDRLLRQSWWDKETGEWRWIRLDTIGSKGALDHLVDKGYVQRSFFEGPRGGRHWVYRPSALLPPTGSDKRHHRPLR